MRTNKELLDRALRDIEVVCKEMAANAESEHDRRWWLRTAEIHKRELIRLYEQEEGGAQ